MHHGRFLRILSAEDVLNEYGKGWMNRELQTRRRAPGGIVPNAAETSRIARGAAMVLAAVVVWAACAARVAWGDGRQGREPPGAAGAAGLRARAAAIAPEIVFAVRGAGKDAWHYYANFGYEVSPEPGKVTGRVFTTWKYGGAGGRLCRMDLRTGEIATIFADPAGDVRDPCVHYGAKRIVFAYRRGGTHTYHLHEINVDGTHLREITRGPWDDIEPAYLPDGDIMFISSRCKRFVPCWKTHVGILYRCRADGGGIRSVSSNVEHDNTPAVLGDGRVCYTRWEYVDRCPTAYHHLWAMYPDGTGQMVFYGNMIPGDVMIDARPIAGTDRVVAVFSTGNDRPAHGAPEHRGAVVVLTPNAGPDDRPGAQRLAPTAMEKVPDIRPEDRPFVRHITPRVRGFGAGFRDPWPLAEDLFLAVEDTAKECALVLLDAAGNKQSLHRLAVSGKDALLIHEPRALLPRGREPVLADRTDLSQASGRMVLADVTHGRGMAGVAPGEVKKLLVLEQLAKPWNIRPGPDMITFGSHLWGQAGAYTLSRIVGTVPVEPDGSACFEVPPLRSLFFVALDADDLSVKRMQSFVTVMPGETYGCVGCHERREDALRESRNLRATRKPPAAIEPIAGVPDVMDFLRDIQPILDRHCVRCHDGKAATGKGGAIDLSARTEPVTVRPGRYFRGPGRYAASYLTLVTRRQNDWVSHAWSKGGNRPPRTIGSSASKLMRLVEPSHYKVDLSEHERALVRLWIDTSAVYAGTYAALGLMPGPYHVPSFRPNEHYVREMKRYGILPGTFRLATDPINVYETDQAYWRSLWHRPAATSVRQGTR